MWAILNGTIVNVFAVLIGSSSGMVLGARLPDRYQRIILDVLGLVTITLGIDAAVIKFSETVSKFQPDGPAGQTFGARLAMVMVGSLVIGAIAGTALRLHERLEGLGKAIHRKLGRAGQGRSSAIAPGAQTDGGRFAEGFLTASVIFCVGPLTLLGCLSNGTPPHDPSLLYIKSCLDLFCSAALASTLGLGVVFSVLTILVFQGGLTLAAGAVAGSIPDLSRNMMIVVGGVVLLATALTLLDIRKIPVANMLPAIFLPPVVIWLVDSIAAGTLMPAG